MRISKATRLFVVPHSTLPVLMREVQGLRVGLHLLGWAVASTNS